MKIKRVTRIILRIGVGFLLAIVAAISIYLVFNYDPPALSHEAITDRVDRLNEAAAVQVPHKSLDDGKTRAEHLQLFEKVELDNILTEEESASYRVVYQGLLQRNQKYLNRFDRNLAIVSNVGMQHPNNVHGLGIEGSHDHHDESARSNYKDMRDSVRNLSNARGALGSFTRIRNAIGAYKDLTDILLHLATAPQTKSVPYSPPATMSTDQFELSFEGVLREFKLAQFQPINSLAYKEHIVLALENYDRLVEATQAEVYRYLTPIERTFAGTWGGWQSLSPSVKEYKAKRILRKTD